MAAFLKLTKRNSDETVLINRERIEMISFDKNGCSIGFERDCMNCSETQEELETMLVVVKPPKKGNEI